MSQDRRLSALERAALRWPIPDDVLDEQRAWVERAKKLLAEMDRQQADPEEIARQQRAHNAATRALVGTVDGCTGR
jgi:hypothetical protein